jgi:hypothetical protein
MQDGPLGPTHWNLHMEQFNWIFTQNVYHLDYYGSGNPQTSGKIALQKDRYTPMCHSINDNALLW